MLTLDEETKLLDALHPRFQRFVRCALGTGCRLDEIRGIDPKQDIDWIRGTVHVIGKFRKERETDEGDLAMFETVSIVVVSRRQRRTIETLASIERLSPSLAVSNDVSPHGWSQIWSHLFSSAGNYSTISASEAP